MNYKRIIEDLTTEFIVQYNIEPTAVFICKSNLKLFEQEIVDSLNGLTGSIDLLGEDSGFEYMNKSIFVVESLTVMVAVGLYNEFYP